MSKHIHGKREGSSHLGKSTSLPGFSLLGVGWGQRVGPTHLEVLKGCSWHCAWGPSPGLLLSKPFQAQDLPCQTPSSAHVHGAQLSSCLYPLRPCHPQSKVSSQSQGLQETFQGFQAYIHPPNVAEKTCKGRLCIQPFLAMPSTILGFPICHHVTGFYLLCACDYLFSCWESTLIPEEPVPAQLCIPPAGMQVLALPLESLLQHSVPSYTTQVTPWLPSRNGILPVLDPVVIALHR